MQLAASKLDKKDFFGKVQSNPSFLYLPVPLPLLSCSSSPLQSDPFVEIAKAQEGGSYTVVYRSKPIMKTLDPRSVPYEIP